MWTSSALLCDTTHQGSTFPQKEQDFAAAEEFYRDAIYALGDEEAYPEVLLLCPPDPAKRVYKCEVLSLLTLEVSLFFDVEYIFRDFSGGTA